MNLPMPTALKKLNAIKDIVLEEKPKICVSVMFLAGCGGEVTRRDLRKAVGRQYQYIDEFRS